MNLRSIVIRFKTFVLFNAILDLFRVDIVVEILRTLLVVARVKHKLVALNIDAIGGIRVELNVTIVTEEVVLMTSRLELVIATVVQAHFFIKAAQRVNTFVWHANVFDLKQNLFV